MRTPKKKATPKHILKNPIPIKEKHFQAQVIKIAKAFGWTYYHTYWSKNSPAGFPDLVLVKNKILYRELKTEKGRLTPAQKMWGENIKKAGGDWDVWRPSMADKIQEELKNG